MCGISGFLSASGLNGDVDFILNKMSSAITSRGPDSSGKWYDDGKFIGLSHRRLAIVDLSDAGHQPMHTDCGRFNIVFNGEIYNHLELRTELNKITPIAWKGHSDTETLIQSIKLFGINETLKKLVGMFAIALWDNHTQTLTLARDRLGEKPLYWGYINGCFIFGSELKSLQQFPNFKPEIDRNSLALFLRYNYIPAPYSIYKNVEKLKAGHYVQISKGQSRETVIPQSYWNLKSVVENGIKNPFMGTADQAVSALEFKLTEAITSQMLADVPLGAFLSGGVDSSTIVSLMQKHSDKRVSTFSIGFDEVGYNEAIFAKDVANYLGTDHNELYVSQKDILDIVPMLPQIYCEPFADSSQLPTFLVSQMAKQKVTVALSGDGGDELFGGYNPYLFVPEMWKKINLLPLPLRKMLSKYLQGLPLPDKLNKLMSVFPAADQQSFYQLLVSHWAYPTSIVKDAHDVPHLLTNENLWPVTDSYEHWMMAMDAGQYMSDDILVKVDRAAMANSLETRVPLLDHRVVEFAWSLPLKYKILDGKGKWVLRELLYKHVPRSLIERPKKGFSVPLGNWLRGPLRPWASELLNNQRIISEGNFHPEPIKKLWFEHLSGRHDHSSKLWSVLMFQAWFENNK